MAHLILVQLLVLLFSFGLSAKVDVAHTQVYLGQKDLSGYSDRYDPLISQDLYQGKLTFRDELFFKNYFQEYILPEEEQLSSFMRSELRAGQTCPNEKLSRHFEDIRYYYRLITLSYLLEGNWHLSNLSKHFRMQSGCDFDLDTWIKSCSPKSAQMKKFIDRLKTYAPKYQDTLPAEYTKSQWYKDFTAKDHKLYSHYRMQADSKGRFSEAQLEARLNKVCELDERLMTRICQETDHLYGLSQNRDAYYLLGISNAVNSLNQSGEGQGCLRRFSEVMSPKETHYPVLDKIFPAVRDYLNKNFQLRFLQGRVFFLGSSEEFDAKGLKNYLVKNQPLKIEKLPETLKEPVVAVAPEVRKAEPLKVVPKVTEIPVQEEYQEIKKPTKSAFLQAAELRSSTGMPVAEVDMLKLKYDYVYSLDMINVLSEKLKVFMTREALKEMMSFDKLGTKDGPVPLMFLKYMIDMEEHQGLWNLLSVLGGEFYVSNEIDSQFNPPAEHVRLVNDESTGNQWQLLIIKP
ncbi:MAG TPA: hypothetical protein VNJ01_03190 [Bacteriovoracaceae bacterium]|nr:hypothetical protein [Bacteriovoracaceae bacterium]